VDGAYRLRADPVWKSTFSAMNQRIAQGARVSSDPPEAPTPARVSISLLSEPSSVKAARDAAAQLARELDPSDEFVHALKLVVSELMTNAVEHGSPGTQVDLLLTLYRDHASVSIHNLGVGVDMARLRKGRPDRGRGLEIVAALADRWGIDSGRFGTTMTARVSR
jgi:anti-sigma regulatory factor (Ser/Thr protein kinase)